MVKKEEILARTSNGLDVFRHYLPVKWRVGRNFLNPLYADSKASCNVYYDRRSGTYRMKDFGNGDYSGDCFFLVAKLKGLDCRNAADFVEVLHTIDRELCLGLEDDSSEDTAVPDGGCRTLRLVPGARENGTRENRSGEGISVRANGNGTGKPDGYTEEAVAPFDRPEPKPYRTTEKPFTDAELAYWGDSGITEELLHRYGGGIARRVPGRDEGRQVVRLQFHPGGTDVRLQGEMGSEGLSPDVGSALRLWRTHGRQLLFRTGTTALEGRPALPHGWREGRADAGGARLPCHLLQLGDLGHPGEDRAQVGLSLQAHRVAVRHGQDGSGVLGEAPCATVGVRGETAVVLPLPGTKAEKDVTDYFKAGHTREELMGLFLKLLDTLYGDTMAVLKSCEIDYDHPPEQAVAIVTAGEVPLGSEENILCITGGEGTGKSNYTAALVAGAIMERETDADLLGVRVEPNRKGRAVLLYDTEQSEQQLYKNTGRLLRRAGRERMPEYLHVYCLTGMSRSERLTAIVQSMDKYHYLHGGIHLVVIDGVADLIRCANDEAESVALIDEIYRLAGIYRTCIAAVVHFVPNGLKLRGHLGSELQRKSAAILSIEKDENPEVSVVKALKVRDGSPLDIPLMQFRWDKQAGMPVYVGEKPRAEKEKRKEKELAEMAREAFARQEKYGYIELCELIQEMLEVKERTAKGYIRYMREKEIIEKEGDCYVHGQGRV